MRHPKPNIYVALYPQSEFELVGEEGDEPADDEDGDFSVECQNPIWVEGGGFQDPVRKAMLSGNLFDALREIGGIEVQKMSFQF